ncbi:MAG TPA: tetratricopeptide repeat protein [Candidatus Polarisedimenticolia bacterium]|nr:tetratricopeptide repeat protein [Candidatus Polarisedimenticolia bacterium]
MPALDRAKTLQAAEKLVRAGKLLEAAKEYQKLADDNPRDMNLVNKLGDLLLRGGQNQAALKQFMRIADFFAKDGFHLKAIAMYKKISKIDPSNLECQQRLALLYHEQGLATEAKAQYQQVADAFVKSGRTPGAAEALRRLLEIDPDNAKVRMSLADLLGRNNQNDDAAVQYAHLARVAAARGAVDEAIAVVRKAIKLSPKNAELPGILLAVVTRVEQAPAELVQAAEEIARHAAKSGRAVLLMAEVLKRAGRVDEADETIRRLDGEDFEDELDLESLTLVGRFHADRGRVADGYRWIDRSVEQLVAGGKLDEAASVVDVFLHAHDSHPEALQRRAAIAAKAGDAEAEARALQRLASNLMDQGHSDRARPAVDRLATLRPGDPATVELVERLQGGKAKPAVAPTRAAPPPAPEPPPVPAPRPAPAAPTQAASEDEEASEIFNLDEEDAEPPAIEAVEEESVGQDEELAIEIEADDSSEEDAYGGKSRIQEIQDADPSGQPIDEEFISEHLTEAEVFVKYGLLDKAREQLKAILKKYPQNDTAHVRLKDLAVSEGNKDAAVRACLALADIRRSQGKDDEARGLVNEAVRIDPDHPELQRLAIAADRPAGPRIVPAAPPPVPPAAAKKGKPAAPAPPPPPAPEFEDDLEIDLDLPEETAPAPAPAPPPAAAKATKPKPAAAPDFATTTAKTVLPIVEEDAGEDATDDLEMLRDALAEPDSEKLGEVDFYIEQGLVDEARQILFQLNKRFPGSDAISERMERLESPRAHASAASAPAAGEDEGVDFEVEQALTGKQRAVEPAHKPAPPAAKARAATPAPPEPKAAKKPHAAPVAPPKAAPVRPVFKMETPVADETGDFFDLAGELDRSMEDEQAKTDAAAKEALDSQAHTFEDIFAAFRKGVEQQVDSDDFDTHYNLGIAYKEMGLVDEAIGEFQFAARDPNRALECCGILGLCFRDKGMPDLALKWYKRGLDMPGLDEHQSVGLRYDMAEVHREKGEVDEALRIYMEVFGVDSTYREVGSRIKELKAQSGKR